MFDFNHNIIKMCILRFLISQMMHKVDLINLM